MGPLELDAETRAAVLAAFASRGASDLRVFGSFARGTTHPGSDIDFIATFPPGFSLFDMEDLERDLEDLLGVPVDVVSDDERGGKALQEIRRQAMPFTGH